MARKVITVQKLNTVAGSDVTFENVDIANGMQFPNDGRSFLFVQTTAGGGIGVNMVSQPDAVSRLGDIFSSVGASKTRSFGPFQDSKIFGDAKGNVFVDFVNATGGVTVNQVAVVSV